MLATPAIHSLAKLRGIWEAAQAEGIPVETIRTGMTAMLENLSAGRIADANAIAVELMGSSRQVGEEWVAEFMAIAEGRRS